MSVTVYKTKTYVFRQCHCVMSCSLVCSFCRWHWCLVYVVAKWKAVLEQNKEEEGVKGVNSHLGRTPRYRNVRLQPHFCLGG